MPLSEFSLVYRYFSALGRGSDVDLSVGDDCAILRLAPGERLATSVDTLVSGVHFVEDMFPEDVGYRAVSVAASDLAAMGARRVRKGGGYYWELAPAFRWGDRIEL